MSVLIVLGVIVLVTAALIAVGYLEGFSWKGKKYSKDERRLNNLRSWKQLGGLLAILSLSGLFLSGVEGFAGGGFILGLFIFIVAYKKEKKLTSEINKNV